MSRTSIYVNFPGFTEQAFTFYKTVFGTEFSAPISRMGSAPVQEGQPPLSPQDANLVMHVALPLLGGVVLMGTDAPASLGFKVQMGNNVYINLEPDTLQEAERLFKALSEGGKVELPLQKMFWGDYHASFTDQFGLQWMMNCSAQQ